MSDIKPNQVPFDLEPLYAATAMRKILVTGALGQIGAELVPALRARHGRECVIASGIRYRPSGAVTEGGTFELLDCTEIEEIRTAVRGHDVGTIYHMAALLSAIGEAKPEAAWALNMGGFANVLEVARHQRCAVFLPSSIGVFGPSTPAVGTPQTTIQRPTTIYGVAKVGCELLADYYAARFGLDTRGLRLPGLISHVAEPGGGTTDYAVEIFYQAIRARRYTCFLRPDTRLDMMYMPDAIGAIMQLMEADAGRLSHRNAFNVTAMCFTPDELAAAIRVHIPDFEMAYEVDPLRQAIAESWPDSMDDSAARADWDWAPRYDLASMVADMLDKLRAKLASE